jgi:hypothetical protein
LKGISQIKESADADPIILNHNDGSFLQHILYERQALCKTGVYPSGVSVHSAEDNRRYAISRAEGQQGRVVQVKGQHDLILARRLRENLRIACSMEADVIEPCRFMTKLPEEPDRARGYPHVGQEFHFGGPRTIRVFSFANQAAYSMACLMSASSSSG